MLVPVLVSAGSAAVSDVTDEQARESGRRLRCLRRDFLRPGVGSGVSRYVPQSVQEYSEHRGRQRTVLDRNILWERDLGHVRGPAWIAREVPGGGHPLRLLPPASPRGLPDGWPSGLRRTPGERVGSNPASWVRIPPRPLGQHPRGGSSTLRAPGEVAERQCTGLENRRPHGLGGSNPPLSAPSPRWRTCAPGVGYVTNKAWSAGSIQPAVADPNGDTVTLLRP